MEKIIIFELINIQEEYAKCLETIKMMENLVPNDSMASLLEELNVFSENVKKGLSPRYFEQPLLKAKVRDGVADNIIQDKVIFNKIRITSANVKDECQNKLHYHLRIHIDNFNDMKGQDIGQFIKLQYLALLLKRVDDFKFFEGYEKRLTVFIVPTSGDNYPFKNSKGYIDCEIYDLISQYLRLLSKKYTGVIYGVTLDKGVPTVTALNFRKSKRYSTYFPLLPIDEVNYNKLFENYISSEQYKELFEMRINGRFGKSRDDNPNEALQDFIAETAIRRLKEVVGNTVDDKNRKDVLDDILNCVLSAQYAGLMQFSIFSFLFHITEDVYNLQDNIKSTWELAGEINQGIKQIVQNSIQHAQCHECYFSFYLHQKREEEDNNEFYSRLGNQYKDIGETITSIFQVGDALEILISDLNENEDMVQNFGKNLRYEFEEYQKSAEDRILEGHRLLLENLDHLYIENFFSDFSSNNLLSEWSAFRSQDLVGHVGLTLLALTAKRCKAALKVISSKVSVLKSNQNYFYKTYGTNKKYNLEQEMSIIPGTHFSILIPIHEWKTVYVNGLGQLPNNLKEDYNAYADFIEYEEKYRPIKKNENVDRNNDLKRNSLYKITNSRGKYAMVQQWKEMLLHRFREDINILKTDQDNKYLFNHDFKITLQESYFEKHENIELCIKGLIEALSIVADEMQDIRYFLALTNLPTGFIDLFKKISIIFSVRKFSPNVQLYLCEEKVDNALTILGLNFLQVIYNAYILGLEHGEHGYNIKEYKQALNLRNILLNENCSKNYEEVDFNVFPFDVVLCETYGNAKTLFEKKMEQIVEQPLEKKAIGYKLENTHMRLGSKVHIESFYEMSFLFYRTAIANRIAILILRNMYVDFGINSKVKNTKVDIRRDSIIFYGYASYSKAILTSITEILKMYRQKKQEWFGNVGFASYQHNLQSESTEIQMYFVLPSEFPGYVNKDNVLFLETATKIVQIVPISSTLTTFNKMLSMFWESIDQESQKKIHLAKNYTLFWIKNEEETSKIKSKYWDVFNDKERFVLTNLSLLKTLGNIRVDYFMRREIIWHDPLKCELCYPKWVINEIPLIGTDVTSTIPSQQVRYAKKNSNNTNLKDNNKRLLELKNCVVYGHIIRRQNHYQYYIDTQKYFYKVKDDVKEWLINRKDDIKESASNMTMHIIFSPEHNTNVGFAQYVNTYYFNGSAEIVSFNVDKEYRSNFICEHAALMELIEELHQNKNDYEGFPIKFYFVDDTIISGETFEKANSFLHSLLPGKEKAKYPVVLFNKVFLLVDRLSSETKGTYVTDADKNFISFLHIDVSNVRIQGDSCIGCKLEQNARRLFKRSATKTLADYWVGKLIDYRKIAYDDKDEIEKIDAEASYNRLLISHILQNVIVNNGNSISMGDAYDTILEISLWLLGEESIINNRFEDFKELLITIKGRVGIEIVYKVLCRPFFSFDFKIRQQVLTLFIFLSESILGVNEKEIIPLVNDEMKKKFLYKEGRIERTKKLSYKLTQCFSNKIDKVLFLQNVLLEGLVDMESTYIMRKDTIKKTYTFIKSIILPTDIVEKFWKHYVAEIHRLIGNNADETKELWLEYLYLTGKEYSYEAIDWKESEYLFDTIIVNEKEKGDKKFFYWFFHEMFLQNVDINFNGLEYMSSKRRNIVKNDNSENRSEYFLEYWHQFRKLNMKKLNQTEEGKINCEAECKLFQQLKENAERSSVSDWYKNFLENLRDLIKEKYSADSSKMQIALLTETVDKEKTLNSENIERLDIIAEVIANGNRNLPEVKFEIKKRISVALQTDSNKMFNLEKDGYTIQKENKGGGTDSIYLIIFFDNPNIHNKILMRRNLNRIDRVFLYVCVEKEEQYMKFILRDILMYRNRIMTFLEKDFSGDIFARYSHTAGGKAILSHEKANSHNTTADDEISIEMFVRPEIWRKNVYKYLDESLGAKWLLLRNYTNGQIAKLFNRIFSDIPYSKQEEPRLYVTKEKQGEDNLFKHSLENFNDLGFITDGRFKFISEVVNLNIRGVENAEFVSTSEVSSYNLEYFKCIIIDICMSAIKYESDQSDYLLRVDQFLYYKNTTNATNCSSKLIKCCSVDFLREETSDAQIDFLLIRNPVDKWAHSLTDWFYRNEIIEKRLQDPYIFNDGHMSLLVIKRYIENLGLDTSLKCSFKYIEKDGQLYFETRLPVLKKEIR